VASEKDPEEVSESKVAEKDAASEKATP